MGEGTQEQTQGEGINLSSKRLAGHGGEGRGWGWRGEWWCGHADKLDKSKAGALGVTAPTLKEQILITLSGSLEGPRRSPGWQGKMPGCLLPRADG